MPPYILGALAGITAVLVYRLTQKNKNDDNNKKDKDKKD